MEPLEIEFLAEETVVTVVPNFNCRKTYLITGELGPFRAGIPLKVPLWLATDLKRRQKCRIVPPAWMDLEKLEKLRDDEAEIPRFCEMPSEYYIVEAKIVLGLGIEDNPSLFPIMSMIKDIWDRRMAKLATSAYVFMHLGGGFVKIPNLTPPELNLVRPILPSAVDYLTRLGGEDENVGDAEGASDSSLSTEDSEFYNCSNLQLRGCDGHLTCSMKGLSLLAIATIYIVSMLTPKTPVSVYCCLPGIVHCQPNQFMFYIRLSNIITLCIKVGLLFAPQPCLHYPTEHHSFFVLLRTSLLVDQNFKLNLLFLDNNSLEIGNIPNIGIIVFYHVFKIFL